MAHPTAHPSTHPGGRHGLKPRAPLMEASIARLLPKDHEQGCRGGSGRGPPA